MTDEVPAEVVTERGVLALEILCAVLPHHRDAGLGDCSELVDGHVLRRDHDGDVLTDLVADAPCSRSAISDADATLTPEDRRRELARGSQLVVTARELAVELPSSKLAEDLPDARRLDESERNQIAPPISSWMSRSRSEVLAQHRSVVTREGEERRIGRERLDERNDPGGVELLRAQPLDDPRGDVIAPTMRSMSRRRTFRRSSQSYASSEVSSRASAAIPSRQTGTSTPSSSLSSSAPSEELRGLLVAPQVRVHGVICVEITEPPDALGGARILEQRDELVAQP
jgi:hypothetical protein